MLRLDKMAAIITDGASAIGRATALTLASEGCNIVLCSGDIGKIKQTASEIQKLGVECITRQVDVTNRKDILGAVSETVRKFKRVDVLVNNAGVVLIKPIESMSEKEWNKVIKTNLNGVFLFTHAVISHMVHQEAGVIINVSFAEEQHGMAGLTAHSTSHFGVIGFTESLAEDVSEADIRVYAVCPRGTDTKAYHSLEFHQKPGAKPEEVAKKILYLLLPGCKIPTGSTVEV